MAETKSALELKQAGDKHFLQKEYSEASELYLKALEVDPDNAIIHSNISLCYLRLEAYGAAITHAKRANEIDPKYTKALHRLGTAHLALTHYREATESFHKLLKLDPKNASFRTTFNKCRQLYNKQQFAMAISYEKSSPIDQINWSLNIPSSYDGPRIEDVEQDYMGSLDENSTQSSKYTIEFIHQVIQWFRDEKVKQFPLLYVHCILHDFLQLMKTLPTVVDLDIPETNHITVCGDTHGQFHDVLKLWDINGEPSIENPYLMNGDYVDRGSYGYELVLVLMLFKLAYPSCMHMTRGNHESIGLNRAFGFYGEVLAKSNEFTFDLFTEVFNGLPLAYVLNKSTLILHGGLFSDPNATLADLRKIDRFCQIPQSGVFADACWSDPSHRLGRTESQRGCGINFGRDVTEKFLEQNNLKLIVRSHEMQQNGFSVTHGGKLVTVFSAPNYVGNCMNKGAYLIFKGEDYVPKQFTHADPPPVPPMKYAMH